MQDDVSGIEVNKLFEAISAWMSASFAFVDINELKRDEYKLKTTLAFFYGTMDVCGKSRNLNQDIITNTFLRCLVKQTVLSNPDEANKAYMLLRSISGDARFVEIMREGIAAYDGWVTGKDGNAHYALSSYLFDLA